MLYVLSFIINFDLLTIIIIDHIINAITEKFKIDTQLVLAIVYSILCRFIEKSLKKFTSKLILLNI